MSCCSCWHQEDSAPAAHFWLRKEGVSLSMERFFLCQNMSYCSLVCLQETMVHVFGVTRAPPLFSFSSRQVGSKSLELSASRIGSSIESICIGSSMSGECSRARASWPGWQALGEALACCSSGDGVLLAPCLIFVRCATDKGRLDKNELHEVLSQPSGW